MPFAFMFTLAFLVYVALFAGYAHLDPWLHPWLTTIGDKDWHWYHYLISVHGMTITYMKSWWWLVYPWLAALLTTLGMVMDTKK